MGNLNETELFYIKDAMNKYYWEAKEKGENEDFLKMLLGINDKIYKIYRNKSAIGKDKK